MDERRCGRCGEHKSLESFAWRRKARGQRDNYCRPCRAAYKQEHYLANRQRYISQALVSKRRLRRERTELLLEYFDSHPCLDCGERDPVVLEFDHLRDKAFNVSERLTHYRWQTILDEIAKCDVVCANCHRRRTARRRGALRLMMGAPEDQ